MKKVLIVNSAKGGVGKTETSKGIAIELHRRGEHVTVIDLDVTTPNIGALEGITTHHAGTNSMLTKKQIKNLIVHSLKETKDGFIIVDTPPTISSLYSAITETVKNAQFLFVTTPSTNAVSDTGVGIRFFARRNVNTIGVVQNMVGDHFGEAFDSDEVLGIKTIGVIPLAKDTSEYFVPIVDHLLTVEFVDIMVQEEKAKVLSNITMKDIHNDDTIPLRFYNLETWDYIKEKLIAKDKILDSGLQSHYGISVKELEHILSLGSHTMIMLNMGISVVGERLPHEIRYAEIDYDNKVSKGTPMFKLSDGTYLWHHECSLVSDREIDIALKEGSIEVEEGRIVLDLFNQMYMNRVFNRDSKDEEYGIVKKHISITGIQPTSKELVYAIYTLEKDGDLSYEDFNPQEYIDSLAENYPDYVDHVKEIATLGEPNE